VCVSVGVCHGTIRLLAVLQGEAARPRGADVRTGRQMRALRRTPPVESQLPWLQGRGGRAHGARRDAGAWEGWEGKCGWLVGWLVG
jgi:hypothetical protein